MRWESGRFVLLRHIWRRNVQYAIPMTVVRDDADRVLLYLQARTPCVWTYVDFETGHVPLPVDKVWTDTNVLQIIEKDAAHAIWVMWSADTGNFLGWYVNLQARAVRVPDGLLSWDHSLDIVVTPDLEWSWKDEDHFERTQELGWYDPDQAAGIRAEGARAIERIERRLAPFSESWPDWRPDPSWVIPPLPGNWAEIPEPISI